MVGAFRIWQAEVGLSVLLTEPCDIDTAVDREGFEIFFLVFEVFAGFDFGADGSESEVEPRERARVAPGYRIRGVDERRAIENVFARCLYYGCIHRVRRWLAEVVDCLF